MGYLSFHLRYLQVCKCLKVGMPAPPTFAPPVSSPKKEAPASPVKVEVKPVAVGVHMVFVDDGLSVEEKRAAIPRYRFD